MVRVDEHEVFGRCVGGVARVAKRDLHRYKVALSVQVGHPQGVALQVRAGSRRAAESRRRAARCGRLERELHSAICGHCYKADQRKTSADPAKPEQAPIHRRFMLATDRRLNLPNATTAAAPNTTTSNGTNQGFWPKKFCTASVGVEGPGERASVGAGRPWPPIRGWGKLRLLSSRRG